jgi:drug/metabolite transporter (DMT)-like permease
VTGGAPGHHGLRGPLVISVVIVADPRIDTDTTSVAVAIPVTIVLMFGGLALRGSATRLARRLDGTAAWAPLLVLAGCLVAAPFYSFDRRVHFILLGLLWGSAWLYMALIGYRHATADAVAGAPRSPAVA